MRMKPRGSTWAGEALEKLLHRKLQDAPPIVLGAIAITEAHAVLIGAEQAVVGDGGFVGIAGEIVEDLIGAGHTLFGVDHPGLDAQRSQKGALRIKSNQRAGRAGQLEPALRKD